MEKSEERIKIEDEIENAHNNALGIAMQMVQDEFGGELEAALADQSFIERMQNKVIEFWEIYRRSYTRLEDLEAREGYPAMLRYANELDLIAKHLPWLNRVICYYPFSGVDFYWARIFKKVVFEDSAFYDKDKPLNASNVWWSLETYSAEKRDEILAIMKKINVFSKNVCMEFLSEDVETCKDPNKFNNRQSTLLIKGGTDVLGYVESKFGNESLQYGCMIIGSSANPLSDMEDKFAQYGYYKHFSFDGEDFVAPYAMRLKDVHVFLKKS
jgi:hypothetical protein